MERYSKAPAHSLPQRTRTRSSRHSLQDRQLRIFGWSFFLMAIISAVSLLTLSGVLPSILPQKFNTPPDKYALNVPCPDSNLTTVELTDLNVNVYNSTFRDGLATATTKELKSLGITVAQTGNWKIRYSEPARIFTTDSNVQKAYTLQWLIPDSVVSVDNDQADNTLVLVLGAKFNKLLTGKDLEKLKAGGVPVHIPDSCKNEKPTGNNQNTPDANPSAK